VVVNFFSDQPAAHSRLSFVPSFPGLQSARVTSSRPQAGDLAVALGVTTHVKPYITERWFI